MNEGRVYVITIVKVPSIKAQEAGEEKSIVAAGVTVVARSDMAAALLAGAANHEKIEALQADAAKADVIIDDIEGH